MIGNDFDDLPPAIRRRLGLLAPNEQQLEAIADAGFRRLREYEAAVLQASAGAEIDPEELLDLAARVGRSPYLVKRDIVRARAAYLAWRGSFDPT